MQTHQPSGCRAGAFACRVMGRRVEGKKDGGSFKSERRNAAGGAPALHTEAGGALIMVLIIICVLSVVASSLLLTTVSRYHTTYQSASWQESIVAAEAGVDLAMNELRKRVVYGPSAAFSNNWTIAAPSGRAYASYGHAFPAGTAPYLLATHGGEGNTSTQARVYVDVPGADDSPTDNFAASPTDTSASFISTIDNPTLADPDGVDRSRWWYRIRALGIAGLSGPPRTNLEKLDNRLRRFSFFTDWRTNQPVASPQTARMVETIVKPLTNFRNALMADKQINLANQDVLVDSYDSSKGEYSSTINHGTMGNIATNGQLINANHATVNGNAMTNNGTVNAGDNVTGQQSSSFYQELTPLTAAMLNPAWSGVTDGGTLTNNATYVASLDPANPTTVRLDGINLPDGGKVISINAPASITDPTDPTPSFIKIYVQGDIATTGSSYINVAAGVNTIIFVTGNVNLQGDGILNNSYLPSRLVLNGIQPTANADGTFPPRNITIGTGQDFQGIVYAPNHDLDLALQAVPAGSSVPSTTIPIPVQVQINSLETQAQQNDNLAANALANYNNAMAAYAQNPTNKTILKQAQQDQKSETQYQNQATKLRQQEATLEGKYSQETYEDHSRGYNGIYGGFVARTITVESKTHIHYDETLRQAGTVNHYEIVSWFEDNLSHDATGGAELFWWQQ